MNVIIYDLPGRAQNEFDEHIDLGAPSDIAMEAACRVATAEELRTQAEYYRTEYRQEHQRANRLANSGQKWKYEAAISTAHTLKYAEKRLTARANELDPDGAR